MENGVHQIVYFSTASGRQDAIVTAGIVAVSRDCNLRDKISGLLVAGGHRYLQVIEGPTTKVDALMARIRRDDRHVGVTVLVRRPIERRSFAGWSMAFGAEPQLDEFATFHDLAGEMRTLVVDPRLRAQIDCFARTFTTAPLRIDATPWQSIQPYPADLAVNRAH